MVKTKLIAPIKVYPDSTRSYYLEDFVAFLKAFNKLPTIRNIHDPTQKKFVSVVLALEKIRDDEPKTKTAEKQQFKELQSLAKEIQQWRNLQIHDKNWLLNTAFINNKQYRARKKIHYKLTDVVLHLLYAKFDKPIHGRIAMTKQVFLAIKEIFEEENVENPKFVPYRYGPYSFLLTHILSNLEYDGVLCVKGRKNTSSEKFSLTDKGLKIAKRKFGKLPKPLQDKLLDRRHGWDQNHIRGILGYVYNKYPEFTQKSMIKNRYKSITWGRAKG